MVKNKRRLIGISMAAIMLCSLCAVCASTSVSATPTPPNGIRDTPAASSRDAHGLDLFVRSANDLYMRTSSYGSWSNWKSLGHPTGVGVASSPSAAYVAGWKDTYTYIRGADGHLWTKRTYNLGTQWLGWGDMHRGVKSGTSPTAVCPTRYDILVAYDDTAGNVVVGRVATPGSSSGGSSSYTWVSIGHPSGISITSSPNAATWTTNGVSIKVRGSDGLTWVKNSIDGGKTWDSWHKIPGAPDKKVKAGSNPTSVRLSSSRLGTAVIGEDSKVWFWTGYKWQDLGGWFTAQPYGQTSQSSVAAVAPPGTSGNVFLFARGDNGHIWAKQSTNAAAGTPTWVNWWEVT